MTQITNGTETFNVYMGNWDGSGYGPDITADLIGADNDGYDYDKDAIIISESMQVFRDWAQEWENGEDEWTAAALNDARSDGDEDRITYITNEISNRCASIEQVE